MLIATIINMVYASKKKKRITQLKAREKKVLADIARNNKYIT